MQQEEQYVRSEGRFATDPLGAGMSGPPMSGGADASMEHVPSDQLWRAAVLAARQAAVTAAELRRAFDETVSTSLSASLGAPPGDGAGPAAPATTR